METNQRAINAKQLIIDQSYIDIAEIIAERSKCVKYQVGCVIVKDDRIISTGYNGTPAGYYNCGAIFNKDDFDRAVHTEWAKSVEIHAEQNAIAILAKNGIAGDGATCYITLQPCQSCLLLLIATGIKRIVYLNHKTDYSHETIRMINTLKISIKEFSPSPQINK